MSKAEPKQATASVFGENRRTSSRRCAHSTTRWRGCICVWKKTPTKWRLCCETFGRDIVVCLIFSKGKWRACCTEKIE